jgi:hypothetical protein
MDKQLKAIEQRMNHLQHIINDNGHIPSKSVSPDVNMYTSSLPYQSVKLKKFDRTSIKQLQTEPIITKTLDDTNYKFDYIDTTPVLIQNNNPFNL